MVQDDVVGHVEALPHPQMVKQGGLPEHIAHVDDRDIWKEEEEDFDSWRIRNNNNSNTKKVSELIQVVQEQPFLGFKALE